ncbi:MAG: DUF6377 domain-containing protein [Bacteroidales bacterium]
MIARIFFLFFLTISFTSSSAVNLDSLYRELDKAIHESPKYVAARQSRIKELNKLLLNSTEKEYKKRYELNKKLSDEYKAYRFDSAIYFLNKNLEVASVYQNELWRAETSIYLSYLLAAAGMYNEGEEMLATVDRSDLPVKLIPDYFNSWSHIYGELGCYTHYKPYQQSYFKKADAYRDSLYHILPPLTNQHDFVCEQIARDRLDLETAMRFNDQQMGRVEKDTPGYSIVTYFRAANYKGLGDREMEKYWLAISAISDIRSAVMDHASLWTLADILRSEGDIQRAHKYIRFSWEETNRYNARLRTWQSSEILSVIDSEYQDMKKKSADRMMFFLLVISLMTFILIAGIFYLNAQKKKLSQARNNLKNTNDQLLKLNQELSESNQKLDVANKQLSETNHCLSETNRIKEEYIGRFLGLCSVYIDKLNNFRNLVNKKIAANQISELHKITKSADFQEKELAELYHNFDSAFLHLFPNFITDFNDLLKENEQISPSKNELLTTELRIFALIRLGIEDSSRIAGFLHYSPNTIYNYRAKVKNKSRISRDEFEEVIKRLG